MKSQILLLFIILFFVSSIFAQPVSYTGFDPDDLCKYKEGKIIFVGRVISSEKVSVNSLPETPKEWIGKVLKHTVSVEKVFSGQLKLQEIRAIFDYRVWNNPLTVNNEHIFIVDEISQNGSKFLRTVARSISFKYSEEEKAIRHSRIEARINRYPKSSPLSGVVLENYVKPKKVSLELSIIYGDEAEKHTPVAGIIVIAKSKKSGQIFRTETNENGVFNFDNLNDGDYALSIVVPKGFEQVFRLEQHKYQERVIPVKEDNCGSAVIFKIRKT